MKWSCHPACHRRAALAYQHRHQSLGLCTICTDLRHPKSAVYCWLHLRRNRLRMRKLRGWAAWRKGRAGRPPVEALA